MLNFWHCVLWIDSQVVSLRDVLPPKNVLILQKDEFYNLVLIDHMNRHISRLNLRPQQGWAEHDSHALGRHPVHLAVIDHSEKHRESLRVFPCFPVNWFKM